VRSVKVIQVLLDREESRETSYVGGESDLFDLEEPDMEINRKLNLELDLDQMEE